MVYRRDSFITHRAFCDALAQESARATISSVNTLFSSETQLPCHGLQTLPLKKEQELAEIPLWLTSQPQMAELAGRPLRHLNVSSPLLPTHLDQSLIRHENPNPSSLLSPSFQPTASPHMSATALLQKASQIGVTVSKTSLSHPRPHHQLQAHVSECTTAAGYNSSSMASSSSAAVSGFGMTSRESYGNKAAGIISNHVEQGADNTVSSLFHDMMSSVPLANGFEDALKGFMLNPQELASKPTDITQFGKSNYKGKNDETTKDFLGLKAFSQKEFFNISGLDHLGSSSYGKQHNQNQAPNWQR